MHSAARGARGGGPEAPRGRGEALGARGDLLVAPPAAHLEPVREPALPPRHHRRSDGAARAAEAGHH